MHIETLTCNHAHTQTHTNTHTNTHHVSAAMFIFRVSLSLSPPLPLLPYSPLHSSLSFSFLFRSPPPLPCTLPPLLSSSSSPLLSSPLLSSPLLLLSSLPSCHLQLPAS